MSNEVEALKKRTPLANVSLWSDDELRQTYKRVGCEWDEIEATAIVAQG